MQTKSDYKLLMPASVSRLKKLIVSDKNASIARFQKSLSFSMSISNGKTQSKNLILTEGAGMHVISHNGGIGFASCDSLDYSQLEDTFMSARHLATSTPKEFTVDTSFLGEITKTEDFIPFWLPKSGANLDFNHIEKRLHKITSVYHNEFPDIKIQSSFVLVRNRWNILRSDGTDVSFAVPRAIIFFSLTKKENGEVLQTYVKSSGLGTEVLYDQDKIKELDKDFSLAVDRIRNLMGRPIVPAGNYPLMIDYGVAELLAHEAFGHLVESDAAKKSVVFDKNGKFKKGMKVAPENVSIIDQSIKGDYAYQPYSANGIKREKVYIVRNGILNKGLSDLFSYKEAGMPLTGAGRVQNYGNVPIPRMSNIHIEVSNPKPFPKNFLNITPEDIHDYLYRKGLLDNGDVLYLTGMKGGQVNPVEGDFMFNSNATYKFNRNGYELFKSGIFNGKTLEALKSIKAGVGKKILNSSGTCGKMGQGVPSAGGSHYFLLLEKNPNVHIGGTL